MTRMKTNNPDEIRLRDQADKLRGGWLKAYRKMRYWFNRMERLRQRLDRIGKKIAKITEGDPGR